MADESQLATAQTAGTVDRFVGTVLGSPSYEAGELVAEQLRAWRFKRELRYLKRAMKQLDDAGLEPHKVPIRILAPLIDGGTLEDDDTMLERWAALLAHASSGRTRIPPSFATLLGELEPDQARMLDLTYDVMMRIAAELRPDYGLRYEAFGLEADEVRYHADNLVRLRLVRNTYGAPPAIEFHVLGLTEFGRTFVRACRPPATPDPRVLFHDAQSLLAADDVRKCEVVERLIPDPAEASSRPFLEVISACRSWSGTTHAWDSRKPDDAPPPPPPPAVKPRQHHRRRK